MGIPGKGISFGNHILGKQQEELLARSWNSRDFSFFSWDSNGEAGQEGEFKEQHPTWKKNFGRPPKIPQISWSWECSGEQNLG